MPRVIYGFGREDQLDKDAVAAWSRRCPGSWTRARCPPPRDDGLVFAESRPYGGAYVLDRLWQRLGIGAILAGLASSGPGPAAGRGRGRAGAVRAGREPGAGAVVEAGGVGVDEPRRAHRRPGRGHDDACYRAMDWLHAGARRAGEAGVLPGRGPAEPSGRSAVLRHDLHLFRDRRSRRGDPAGLARGENRRPGRHSRGPGRADGGDEENPAGKPAGFREPTASPRTPATTCPRS